MPKNNILIASTTIATCLGFTPTVKAQVRQPIVPPSEIPKPPQLPTDTLQAPTIDPRPIEIPITPAPTFTPRVPPIGASLFISEVQFIGNTVFTDEQLAEIAKPYLNREVSYAELLQLRSKITALYIDHGYASSRAYLASANNQTINREAATISLQIIEGTIEDIYVSGDLQLERYVKARLRQATSPVLNQPKLQEAVQLLQIDPLIQSISVNLSTGTEIGSNILSVKVDAQPNFQIAMGTDNNRTPSIGSIQGETRFTASNLLETGEQISVGYHHTDGSNGFNAGVQFPLNAKNGTLSFDYAQFQGQIVEEPLNDLEIKINSQVYGLSIYQPLFREVNDTSIEEFKIGITLSRTESKTTLAGFPFPLSPGANDKGETRITELAFLQDYSHQNRDSTLLMRSRFGLGIEAFDATKGPEPNGQYLTWRGQALWQQNFWEDAQLRLSGDIQLSDAPLVPINQFSIGGPSSIRGYRQGAITADNGLIVTTELAVPLLEARNQQLSVIPFAGTGIGWNKETQRALDRNFIASIGIGAQYERAGFIARVNYAIPFTQVGTEGNSLQEKGLDFSLIYQFRF